jgi:hypothetical protein
VDLRISFSAAKDVLETIASEDRRIRVSRERCLLEVSSDTPAAAIVELKGFAERIRKATKSERV